MPDNTIGSAYLKIEPDFSGFAQQVQAGVSGALSGAVGAFAQVARAGLEATAVAMGAAVITGLTFGAQLDRLRASFDALTGSTAVSNQIIASMRHTAITTGQDFGNLAAAAQRLLASGIGAPVVIELTSALGVYATVFGRNTQALQRATIQFEEIALRGKATGQNLNALARDGIPIYKALQVAAENLGIVQRGQAADQETLTKAMTEGRISVTDLFHAMSDPAVIGSANAALAAIQTNVGFQLSQIRTAFTHTLGQIAAGMDPSAGGLGGVINQLGRVLQPFTNQLLRLTDSATAAVGGIGPLQIAGDQLGKRLAPLIPIGQRVGDALKRIVDQFIAANGNIDPLLDKLRPFAPLLAAAAGAGTGLAAGLLRGIPVVGEFAAGLNPLVLGLAALVATSPVLRNEMASIGRDLQPAITALGQFGLVIASAAMPVLETFGATLQVFAYNLAPVLVQVFQALAGVAPSVGDALSQVLVALSGLAPVLAAALLSFVPLIPALANLLVPALQALAVILSTVTPWLAQLAPLVGPLVAYFVLWEPATTAVTAAMKGFTILTTVVPMLWDFLAFMRAAIATEGIWTAVQWGLNIAMDANPIGLVVIAVAALIGIIILAATHTTELQAAFWSAWGAVSAFAGVVGTALVTAWNTVAGFVTGVLASIVGFGASLLATVENVWAQFTARPLYWIGFLLGYLAVTIALLPIRFAGWFNGILGVAASWAGQMIAHGFQAAIGFVNAVNAWFGSLPGRIASFLSGAMAAAWAFASDLPQAAWSAASRFSETLMNTLRSIDLWSIGTEIVQGLVNGINGMYGAVWGAVHSIVEGALAGGRAAANSGSPARAFMPLGHEIVQGVAVGIQQMSDHLTGTFAGAIGQLSGGLPSLSPAMAAANPMSAGGPSNLTINVTVSGTNLSPDDIADAIAWKLSRRGVSY